MHGRPLTNDLPMARLIELVWLAGMIDGEGWIGVDRRGNLRFSMSQNDRSTLEKCQHISGGLGNITKHSGENARAWKWCVNASYVQRLLEMVIPWMWAKRAQAQVALWSPAGRRGKRSTAWIGVGRAVARAALGRMNG